MTKLCVEWRFCHSLTLPAPILCYDVNTHSIRMDSCSAGMTVMLEWRTRIVRERFNERR
ncbi:MAG: hypothetical protein ACRC46_14255 [Thermoguttaceae bacterium]